MKEYHPQGIMGRELIEADAVATYNVVTHGLDIGWQDCPEALRAVYREYERNPYGQRPGFGFE